VKYIRNILFFLILPLYGWGQLVTSGAMTPNNLVQNVLVGQGVTVSNVFYSGANSAIGRFDGSNTSLGLDAGIILTTGTINAGNNGPYGPNNRPNAGIDNNAGGFAPLTNLVGTNTYNASILEFDFVPQSDTVKFKYVFGSEEYPEWVGDQFNDVFAFFISGPGINGLQNMAIIPGTNQPVAINNVNNGTTNNGPCKNCNYYVNNGTGNNAPFNQNPFYIQYDGFTVPLEAVSPVQCGETYHLIIAVADVGDAIFDSGIFLEANSLSSEQPINIKYSLSSNPYGDGQTMAQGCTSATVTITRSGNGIDEPVAIPISVSGSAIEGLDYSSIPNVVNFAANQTTVSFTVDALNNPDLVGTANIKITFEISDACGEDNFQEIELFINPVESVSVTVTSGEIQCPGDEIQLTAEAFGGGGGYIYTWNTGETTSSIFVNPESTQTYTVSVTDDCLNETASANSTVTVPEYEPLIISTTPDIEEDCPYMPFDIVVEALGGAGNYTFNWTDGNEIPIGNAEAINIVPESTSTYYIKVTDFCGEVVKDSVTITILSPPLELWITPEVEICPNDSIQLTVEASGGFGDYYYYWPHSGDTVNTIYVAPYETTTYSVRVNDDCKTFYRDAVTTVIVVHPIADFDIVTTPLFIDLPITFENQTTNGDTYEWWFGDGNTSTMVHPNNQYSVPGDYEITLVARDEKGCLDTISKIITLLEEVYLYIPNAFTPDGNRFNNTFSVSAIGVTDLNIKIFNRWGEFIYESNDVNFEWDGYYKGQLVRDGTYVWKISYRTINDDELEIQGHVTVLE